ncbi:MAG TPA: DMT family transporter [Prolixibacteraceae bacterium]|nr:DMT family transporter [Prolixibacteraceae bacterium]
MNKPQQALIFAASAVLCWSTVPTAFKLALRTLAPAQLIWIASGVSVVFLFGYLLASRQLHLLKATSGRELLHSALLGALNPFVYYLVLLKAYSLLPAQLAQPLNMVWPIALALLSIPLLKQKIGWRHFSAMFISFAGVVVISSQGGITGFGETSLTGVALALGSSILWALYWILNVRDQRPEALKLFLGFCFGFLYLTLTLLFLSGFTFRWNESTAAAIYTGFFEVGIAYLLWMKAMQSSRNNATIGNLVFATPFISLIFISIFLKEKIFLTTFIGLLLIVGGILLQQLAEKKYRHGNHNA